MAGHSKWASIKHKKAVVDSRRGKLFTKLGRAITVAAREGGGDPDGNPSLALAIQKARDASMPKDNIERAIARGTGEGADADAIEAVTYEGYGPGGVALLIEALTDNRNRTGAEVRHALTKHGGSLGEPGSVAYLVDQCGLISVDAEPQPLLAGRAALGGLLEPTEDLGGLAVDELDVKLALGVEVLVDQSLGDAGRRGDLLERGAVVAGTGEDLRRRVEQCVPPRGGAHPPPGRCAPVAHPAIFSITSASMSKLA